MNDLECGYSGLENELGRCTYPGDSSGENACQEDSDQGSFRRGSSSGEDGPRFNARERPDYCPALNVIRSYGAAGITKTDLRKEAGRGRVNLNNDIAALIKKGLIEAQERKTESGRNIKVYVGASSCRK
ncbi:MAG: hypothetical protein NT001_03610 [Candidatus Woesearchaeota archaeon]|nr:hypothetical protein [Candidatus Woesearchaeota archaeon]